jgi:hypothetical protein
MFGKSVGFTIGGESRKGSLFGLILTHAIEIFICIYLYSRVEGLITQNKATHSEKL